MKSDIFNKYPHLLGHTTMSVTLLMGIFTSCQEEDFGFTAEEITYETKFFKEFGHPDPDHNWGFTPMEVIDNTSSETRAAGPNANEWGSKGLDVPLPLTDTQKTIVTEWFESHPNPQGITVSWTDYFAQQVSSTSNATSHMNYLLDAGNNYQDHIYNANSGDISNNNVKYLDGHYGNDHIQYMTGQSTEAFGYHDSFGNRTYFDHYVIIPGSIIDPTDQYGIKGMYFVGFDYLGEKDLSQIGNCSNCNNWFAKFVPKRVTDSSGDCYKMACSKCGHIDEKINNDKRGELVQFVPDDGYYNDWIVRICPGTCSSISQRVMCEDLGNSFDWDFNDVVFDVYFTTDWVWNGLFTEKVTTAHITIQCAGGTMPIYVGTTDTTKEVHKLVGDGSMAAILYPASPAQYNVKVDSQWWLWSIFGGNRTEPDASMIPIYVNGTNTNVVAEQLQAKAVPQKFACPTTVAWSAELTNIAETYPRFTQWVQNANAQGIWEYNPKK